MKRKHFLLLAMLSIVSTYAWADEPDGIFSWQDGKGTCYQLSDNPTFTYDDDGNLVVTIGTTEKRKFDISEKDAKVNYDTYAAVPEVTLNSNGYATFSFNHDVTVVTSGVTANTLKKDDDSYNLSSTAISNNNIPSCSGVLLSGEENTAVEFYFLETAPTALTGNELVSSTNSDGSAVTHPGEYTYVLNGDRFKHLATDKTLPANRAYLYFSTDPFASGAKEFVIDLNGGATGISNISSENILSDGKYLIDGSIVIVRGGKQYDLNGILKR